MELLGWLNAMSSLVIQPADAARLLFVVVAAGSYLARFGSPAGSPNFASESKSTRKSKSASIVFCRSRRVFPHLARHPPDRRGGAGGGGGVACKSASYYTSSKKR